MTVLTVNPGGATATILTVDPWHVEPGDIIAGRSRRPVHDILYNGSTGRWEYHDPELRTICSVPVHGRIQVLRRTPVDDCPPHGIARPRHLEVVRWS